MELPCWWLSFGTQEDGPRGACIVPVPANMDGADEEAGMAAATRLAWKIGCNPGGDVGGAPFDGASPEGAQLIKQWGIGILHTPDALRAAGMKTLSEMEEGERPDVVYKLIDKMPVPCPALEVELTSNDRVVAQDHVGELLVSTVFLALDHGVGGSPLLFETMVFGADPEHYYEESYCERYGTYAEAEAEAGHARVLAAVRQATKELGR